jgi:tRNA modification GTPase
MYLFYKDDTISAIATPKGKGAISLIRISGRKSLHIFENICSNPKSYIAEVPRKLILSHIKNYQNEIIDQVLVIKYLAPNSYTGEDMIEISCHGSPYIAQEILSLILKNGARLAEPGEFTKRAFLNGKIDLLQAEAVADIIDSQTQASLRLANAQLSGKFSNRLFSLKESLKTLYALLELELDFSEEDMHVTSDKKLFGQLDQIIREISDLIQTFKYGHIIKEGVRTAIIGAPNVGKSSIFNQILQQERVIVTDIPGTTRDIIEESVNIDGILFKIIDTAGLRETTHPIEMIGIEKTEQQIEHANILIFVLDISQPLDNNNLHLLTKITKKAVLSNQKLLILLNKCDLKNKFDCIDIPNENNVNEIMMVSALDGTYFTQLKEKLVSMVFDSSYPENEFIISKIRHKFILEKTLEYLNEARKTFYSGYSSEFIVLDIQNALNLLGQLTGEVTSQDILNEIFEKFCIGK